MVRRRDVVSNRALVAQPGEGRWLAGTGEWAARPTERLSGETNPALNFGAELL